MTNRRGSDGGIRVTTATLPGRGDHASRQAFFSAIDGVERA
jgi:hypothetical protein